MSYVEQVESKRYQEQYGHLKVKVDVTDDDANQVDDGQGFVHEQRHDQQDPREPRSLKVEHAHKVHQDVRVLARPNVHHHKHERRAQEVHRHKRGEGLAGQQPRSASGNRGWGGCD